MQMILIHCYANMISENVDILFSFHIQKVQKRSSFRMLEVDIKF